MQYSEPPNSGSVEARTETFNKKGRAWRIIAKNDIQETSPKPEELKKECCMAETTAGWLLALLSLQPFLSHSESVLTLPKLVSSLDFCVF